MIGHLDVHQDEVEGLAADGGEYFFSIAGHSHLVPGLLQDAHREQLIDGIILGDQDVERAF